MSIYDVKNIKVQAIADHVLVANMNFEEKKTSGGIILRSDNAKSHGVHPRWAQIYSVGPQQTEYKKGDWILVEHGRWTRGIRINDGSDEMVLQRIDTKCVIAVSETAPTIEDEYITPSL